MVQNHVLQLLTLVAMEPPIAFDASAVRDEKVKVLHALQPLVGREVTNNTIRAQYGPGWVGGQQVPGYLQEPGIPPTSTTETYVAIKMFIDNWRWAGVPFYLRTGKRLKQRHTEIAVQFKRAPFVLFRQTSIDQLQANQLVIQIQPEEGISLSFGAKIPGPVLRIGSVDMSFQYSQYFGADANTGYEVLLYDCMMGDATLFQRADMVEAGWAVVDPVLDVWKALPARSFPNYASGSWGPRDADELIERDERHWRKIAP
jgi:glucose-6-phosphate 1-dehydrogenase